MLLKYLNSKCDYSSCSQQVCKPVTNRNSCLVPVRIVLHLGLLSKTDFSSFLFTQSCCLLDLGGSYQAKTEQSLWAFAPVWFVCFLSRFQNDAALDDGISVSRCQMQHQEGTMQRSLTHGTVWLAQGRMRAANYNCAELQSAPAPFTPVTTVTALTTAECVWEGLVSQIVTFPCSDLVVGCQQTQFCHA